MQEAGPVRGSTSSSGKLAKEPVSSANMEIEQASDDEELDSNGSPVRKRRRRLRGVQDDDYDGGAEVEAAEESDEAPLDDLEPESLVDQEEESRLKKKAQYERQKQTAASRRHRTEVEEAKLDGDEQEETVFIDNLPNDEQGIRSMLGEVRRNIIKLEKVFLMEEDSDAEEDEKLLADLNYDANLQIDDEEEKLAPVSSYIKGR